MKKWRYIELPLYFVFVILVTLLVFLLLDQISNSQTERKITIGTDAPYLYVYIEQPEDHYWRAFSDKLQSEAQKRGILLDEYHGVMEGEENHDVFYCALNSDVDGLVFCAKETPENIEVVEQMKEKKQTLITVADDFENIAGIYHVGTPLYSLGKTLGEMVQKDHNSGQVFIITHDAASDRMKGILDQLEADFSVEILEVGSQNTLITMDAAQKVLLQHREDIILIGDGLVSLTGVLRATVDLNRLQNVDIYGFGYSEEIAEALEYGGIHGTIDEDPEWLAVNALNTFEASYYNRPELLEENTFFPRIYYTRN